MIQDDPRARIVDKASGAKGFEDALRWALEAGSASRAADS